MSGDVSIVDLWRTQFRAIRMIAAEQEARIMLEIERAAERERLRQANPVLAGQLFNTSGATP